MKNELRHQLRRLVDRLNLAGRAYYQQTQELMSDKQYDALYDQLVCLERQTGIVYADSPTVNVGYQVVSGLPKEQHQQPMLSLDKTKKRTDLADFLVEPALMSWKLDGLTIVLTYQEGQLIKAITRGNGLIGEVVTGNVKTFKNLPLTIPFKGELVVRGEAVISFSDFEKINEVLEEPYKNPRNLASGSVRQLNSQVTAERRVRFYAFSLVEAKTKPFAFKADELSFLEEQGLEVVEHCLVNRHNFERQMNDYQQRLSDYQLSTDGLVFAYNDIAYSQSLGRTAKFPKDALAYKWADTTVATQLLAVEWSPSRTGLLNPIAEFTPIELEGTTVRRASLHNVSILKNLALGLGDTIEVYKANMIIPQVADNLSRTGTVVIPETCPVCGQTTVLEKTNGVEVLRCPNPTCSIKQLKKFSHFVSRQAMAIDGLSEATLEKLVKAGLISDYADIYQLTRYQQTIIALPGLGQKSYQRLIENIDRSRRVDVARLINALGIGQIGLSNAKLLAKHFDYQLPVIMEAQASELELVDGFGPVISQQVSAYFSDPMIRQEITELLKQLELQMPTFNETQQLTLRSAIKGKVFVITGKMEYYENRQVLKEAIEQAGGQVVGSVSSKTDYLINNDTLSVSAKNKKAKELAVPVIDEGTINRWLE